MWECEGVPDERQRRRTSKQSWCFDSRARSFVNVDESDRTAHGVEAANYYVSKLVGYIATTPGTSGSPIARYG
jgi:hypothetical protein